jgi:hypothetical protein
MEPSILVSAIAVATTGLTIGIASLHAVRNHRPSVPKSTDKALETLFSEASKGDYQLRPLIGENGSRHGHYQVNCRPGKAVRLQTIMEQVCDTEDGWQLDCDPHRTTLTGPLFSISVPV